MADREYGFRTRAIHAGNIPDAGDGRPRAADLPVERVRLRRHRGCRGPLRAAEVRQHLLAASRTRRSRASRSASRASRAASAPSRPHRGLERAVHHLRERSPAPATTSSPRANLYGGSITQLDVTLRRFGVDTTFVRSLRPRRLRRGDHRQDEADLRRDDREPVRRDRRPRGPRRGRARARHPAHHRLDHRDAVPQPPDRVGRRHRHPLGDEVPRRPRHDPRRRRRRVGPLPLGERASSRCSTSRCRSYGGLQVVRATSASTRSSPACAPSSCATSARRSRRTRRSCSRRASRRCRSACRRTSTTRAPSPSGSRPTRASSTSTGPGCPTHPHHERAQKYLPKGPGSVFSFGVKGGRAGRPDASSRSVEPRQPPRQHRRREDARHPPGVDHPRAAQRAAAARRGRAARRRAHQRGHRGPRGHHRRPRPGADRRDGERDDITDATTRLPTAAPTTSRPCSLANGLTCELPASSPLAKLLQVAAHLGRARREGAPARSCARRSPIAIVGASPNPARSSYFVGTYLQQSSDYRAVLREPERRPRSSARRPTRPRRPARGARHRRRVPHAAATSRRSSTRCSPSARRRSGCSSASGTRMPRYYGESQGAHRRHGPLHQGRARPLPRRPAPARLRHRPDHLAQDARAEPLISLSG